MVSIDRYVCEINQLEGINLYCSPPYSYYNNMYVSVVYGKWDNRLGDLTVIGDTEHVTAVRLSDGACKVFSMSDDLSKWQLVRFMYEGETKDDSPSYDVNDIASKGYKLGMNYILLAKLLPAIMALLGFVIVFGLIIQVFGGIATTWLNTPY